VEFYNRPFILKHFDFNWYEDFIDHGKLTLFEALNKNRPLSSSGKLVNPEKFSRQEAENLVAYYRLMLRSTGRYNTKNMLMRIIRYWSY
jgi:hypothetical protein